MIGNDEFKDILASFAAEQYSNEAVERYWSYLKGSLRGRSFDTSLGTATVTEVEPGITFSSPPTYCPTVTIELPRLDKAFRVSSKVGTSDALFDLLQKTAKPWATKEAGRIVREEDRESGILERRRADKFLNGDPRHALMYEEGCRCAYCRATTDANEWGWMEGGNSCDRPEEAPSQAVRIEASRPMDSA